MSVRFGVNPIGWSNDDLRELGGKTPLETCLTEAKQAGYEGIELGHKFPREAKALKAVLSAHGLDLVSGWYSSELLVRDAKEELKHLRAHLDLLKALGSRILILAETSNAIHGDRGKKLSTRPKLKAANWREFGQRVTEVAEAVAKEDVGLAYHHHMGTVVQSGEDIDAFMESTGSAVKLLLDTGHATFGGADPVALAKKYRARIAHVHCKDVRRDVLAKAREKDWSFLDAVVEGCFTVPGDGMVDFPAVLGALPGYSGWLVVEAEQDPEKANPLKYATMGCANLKRYAKDAGLA
jgi:inosose dehydratase/3D-(3,5/4)-trihydroxycyclohexane-1,2-dione acylhydrolase (decyclizing)